MKRILQTEIDLAYISGKDDPDRGIFRNLVVDPKYTDEIIVAVRGDVDNAEPWPGKAGAQAQVHLAGTSRALEELGKYLIALARLDTADPQPYGSFDDVRNADGGSVRLLPRRLNDQSADAEHT